MNDAPDLERGKDIGSAEHTRTIPTKRAAAAMLFTDGQGRVLLCQPTYKDVAEAPGGAGEVDESPLDTAAREVTEELGLIVEPGRLFTVDYAAAQSNGRSESVIFAFDGGLLTPEQTDAIVLDLREIASWSWCTVAEVRNRMRPLVARRIEAALRATRSGETLYLENGYPVGSKPAE